MSKRVIVFCVLVSVFVQPILLLAQEYNPDEDLPKPTRFEKSLTKLGRGLSNVMFGWAELPLTFDKKLKEGKPFGYLFGVVPVLGTARAVMRTGTGVFEAVTFPVTDKDVNFQPILEPEFLF
ncbi:MAG TPA: exosortase system-associated protein, TIGR04073 family [Candidatus Hydrogenedens sp.]|nr:exosortase system-associated protein, TIGR04073 family [Candidatus Hydrogenedens sp.]HOL19390.1 exosortase system-associated protein, TIGR04073 family [Candidatus Hydrogenedens sp.]HPP58042.1 exosortase system-associated protein, TIGR04073 family [Candidatus Hydrogenedens sp.]